MEWLIGVLVGGIFTLLASALAGAFTLLGTVVGAALGFAVTEVRAHRDVKRRQRIIAGLLASEVSLNLRTLEQIVSKLTELRKQKRTETPAGAPLTRTVLTSSVTELGLLPSDTRFAVLNFYACLDDVEFFAEPAKLAPNQKQTTYQSQAELGLQRAKETLSRLDKISA